jgi:predicted nucleic acid-binding protein
LQEGVFLAKDPIRAAQSLATVKILPVDEETCHIFGELSATLHRKGNHPAISTRFFNRDSIPHSRS